MEAVGSYKDLQESSVDWNNVLVTKNHEESEDGGRRGEVKRRDSNMTLSGSVEVSTITFTHTLYKYKN